MKQLLSLVTVMGLLFLVGCGGGDGDATPAATPAELALVGHWVAVNNAGTEWFLNADGKGHVVTSDGEYDLDFWRVSDDGLIWLHSDFGMEYKQTGDNLSVLFLPGNIWVNFVRQ